MRLKSHLVVGAAIGIIIAGINIRYCTQPTPMQSTILFFTMLGSVAPDVDIKLSGFKNVPFKKRTMLSHRGITHHVILPFLIAVVGLFCYGLNRLIVLSFAVGVATHILMDMFSPLGVPYGVRYKERIRLPVYRTGGLSELVVVGVVLLIVFMYEYWIRGGAF